MNQEVLWLIATPFIAILLIFTIRRIIFTISALQTPVEKQDAGLGYLPDLLILVSCRDEAAVIPGLCQALSQLNYPRKKLQIALIDDASADPTGRIMEQQAASQPDRK